MGEFQNSAVHRVLQVGGFNDPTDYEWVRMSYEIIPCNDLLVYYQTYSISFPNVDIEQPKNKFKIRRREKVRCNKVVWFMCDTTQ